MYDVFLFLHNLFRWVVVVLAVVALVTSYLGWFGKRPWTDQSRRWGSFFAMSLDIQLLLGLILYFAFSPIVRTALQDFGAAMGNDELRFFALEHFFYMLLAVVFAHMGTIFSRRADTDQKKYRNAAIFFTLAVLIIVLGMPWTRPLFRLP